MFRAIRVVTGVRAENVGVGDGERVIEGELNG